MFTFSFGTALADVGTGLTDTQQAAYDAAVGPSGVILNAKFETAWAANEDHGIDDYLITTKAYVGLKDDALTALTKEIYDTAKADTSSDTAALTKKLVELFDTNDEIIKIIDKALKQDLAQAQFAIDYATEIAKLDTVDVTAYSTEDYDDDYTHQEKAAAIIADTKAKAATKAATIDSDSTVNECLAAWLYINSIVSDDLGFGSADKVVKKVMLDGGIFSGVYELTDAKLMKVEDAAADKAVTEAEKAALKAVVAKNVATYRKDLGAKADATLIAAYTELYTVLIDEELVSSESAIYAVSAFATGKLVGNYNKVQELVTFADKYKAERDADGNLVRDAEAIDKIVKAAKKEAYNADQSSTEWGGLQTAKDKIEATTLASTAEGLAYAKQTAKTLAENYVADNADDYYPAELAQLNTLVEEFNAKVDAATKTADITKATTGLKAVYFDKFDAVKTSDDVDKDLKAKSAYDAAKKALENYVDYYNKTLTTAAEAVKKLDAAAIDDVLCEFYGENGARTEAAMKALKDEIIKLVDKLPTAGAQADAKKAAQDAIDALPATITLADEATVQAAVDAVNAYADLCGTDLATKYTTALDNARVLLYNAYVVDLNKKVVAVDKTDKAALNALKAEFEAAEKKNGKVADGKCLSGTDLTTITAYKTVTTALDEIQTAEKAAVKKAINAIPVNVTEADKATVEAARKLYDAYVAEYTDYEDKAFAGNAANEFTDCYRTLALAEAALGLNYDAEENAKAYVQDLKIAARSTKTSKGVKVTINADVQPLLDAGFTVEYKFYRSTKSNKNFGTAKVTKTENTYLNTAGTKGTRYYYKAKLVVKNAAGEVVATTPLTQCLYATRVF